MTDKQAVDKLLSEENIITNHIHDTIREIMRLRYESERGKKIIPSMIENIRFALEDMEDFFERMG